MGNYSQVLNLKYQERQLLEQSISEWNMPEFGFLEFDYMSMKRPPPNAIVLDVEPFTKILTVIQSAENSLIIALELAHITEQQARLRALRMVSHTMYINSSQLRELMGTWQDEYRRAECFVMFVNQIVDMYNEKIFRVRFEDAAELVLLRQRLGHATYFPFMQPEQAHFCLDLAFHDQRLAANLVVSLAAKERYSNLMEPSYVHADGTVDALPQGVPHSWEVFTNMPKEGTFEVTYRCSPEDRNFKLRKQLLENYGFCSVVAEEDDVQWWGSLTDLPMDVLEYLDFLVIRYPDIYKAFCVIDGGRGGNGVISFNEFEKSIKDMECLKFKGPEESQRIRAIFRYLDPSNEGEISVREWGILEKSWKEIILDIHEFLQFCDRSYGGDMNKIWQALDADDSNEITETEWHAAVKNAGYFGPSMQIFRYVDKDDEGTISLAEFETLWSLRQRQSSPT